jgi:hypothetical protein
MCLVAQLYEESDYADSVYRRISGIFSPSRLAVIFAERVLCLLTAVMLHWRITIRPEGTWGKEPQKWQQDNTDTI